MYFVSLQAMELLFWVFNLCVLVQVFMALWMLWADTSELPLKENQNSAIPVSIIICAKNEYTHLKENILLLLEQDYPLFELIVVNDGSTDQTAQYLNELSQKYSKLKVCTLSLDAPKKYPGKKNALAHACEAAQYEILLLCDADCKVQSQNWITRMVENFDDHVDIVAGYGGYDFKNTVLNYFIRWETLHSFVLYSSFAKRGRAYMAVGRNMAIRKALLQKAQNDPRWVLSPSGDDDLLVQIGAQKNNVRIEARMGSFTYSPAKDNWKSYLLQKQRHLSTGKFYKKSTQYLLGAYAFSHAAFWLLALLLFLGNWGYLIYSLMLIRCIIVYSLWAIHAVKLNEKKLIPFFILMDIAWLFYNVILSPYIFFKTQQKWK